MKNLFFILLMLIAPSYIISMNYSSVINKQSIFQRIPIVIYISNDWGLELPAYIDNKIINLRLPGFQLETRKYYSSNWNVDVAYKAHLQLTENNLENTIQNLKIALQDIFGNPGTGTSITIKTGSDAIKEFEKLVIQKPHDFFYKEF